MTKEEYEKIRNLNDEERKEFMNFKAENEHKVGDMWIPLFTSILAMNNQPNIELEKKIAYLSGKVDTLEKIITG